MLGARLQVLVHSFLSVVNPSRPLGPAAESLSLAPRTLVASLCSGSWRVGLDSLCWGPPNTPPFAQRLCLHFRFTVTFL